MEQVHYFGGWAQVAKSIWCQCFADGQTTLAKQTMTSLLGMKELLAFILSLQGNGMAVLPKRMTRLSVKGGSP